MKPDNLTIQLNSVHIIAEIWSASFYQATVNGLTMSESVPRAFSPSGTDLMESLEKSSQWIRLALLSGYTEGIKAQAGRFLSLF